MKISINYLILSIVVALVVGGVVGTLIVNPEVQVKTVEVEKVIQEVCTPTVCEVPTCEVTKEVYSCEDTFESKYDNRRDAEDDLGVDVYKMKSSKNCSDFLDEFDSEIKEIVDLEDTSTGCRILYIID